MKPWFFAVVALQLLFVAGEAATYQHRLKAGREVVLKASPVDPRSLFMGNYMVLSFDISMIDVSRVKTYQGSQLHARRSDDVWVELAPGRPYATVQSVSAERPDSLPAENVLLHGRVREAYGNTVTVDYGIERYYIPENRSDEVNRMTAWNARNTPQITVTVSIPNSGQPLIRRVLVDGKAF